jgi:hypothetical protein
VRLVSDRWQLGRLGPLGSHLLPLSLNVSISRVQNFAHNISIPMDKDKKGVGGWAESWWIV